MIVEPLADQIIRKVKPAAELYHRLILVVAPAGAGKTTVLRDVRDRIGASLVNVNLALSRRMLELTERQRGLQLRRLLEEIIFDHDEEIILLDNIEIIFDPGLHQDPLRLLQGISRNKTVVAAWSGAIVEEFLTYAAPDHAEYRRYPMHDCLVVSPRGTT
ncbi:MAG: BREX-3 system P-loop-containing protein BrxF [Desulfurellaceae bacterium]|nr:BREX-3 system P-loop-containing protein BrxF [Desulfurellaceae bacterium]